MQRSNTIQRQVPDRKFSARTWGAARREVTVSSVWICANKTIHKFYFSLPIRLRRIVRNCRNSGINCGLSIGDEKKKNNRKILVKPGLRGFTLATRLFVILLQRRLARLINFSYDNQLMNIQILLLAIRKSRLARRESRLARRESHHREKTPFTCVVSTESWYTTDGFYVTPRKELEKQQVAKSE